MPFPDYTIEHVKAHKDAQERWRAETIVRLGDALRVRILSMPRPDGSFATTARATRSETRFDHSADFYKELRTIRLFKVTRDACNRQHYAAVFDLLPLVQEIAKFYQLTAD